MVGITLDDYIKVQAEYVTNEAEERTSIEYYVRLKIDGGVCHVCGQPIWAIGSATIDDNMCFTCITGEADDSDDYEILEVCWR